MMLDTCPTCGAGQGGPCVTLSGAPARSPHVARTKSHPMLPPETVVMTAVVPVPPTEAEVIAEDSQAVWADLSWIQEDAIRATADQIGRDPAELAVELFPHLYYPKGAA